MMPNLSLEIRYILYFTLNAVAGVIFFCILMTLAAAPKNDRKIRRLLTEVLLSGVAASVLCSAAAAAWLSGTDRTVLTAVNYASYAVLVLYELFKAALIFSYSGRENRHSNLYKYIDYTIFALLILVHAIPPAVNRIYYFPEGSRILAYGPWYPVYTALFLAGTMLPVISLLTSWRRIGKWAALQLLLIETSMLFSYFVLKDESTTILFFGSVFLMVYYISIYQGEIYQNLRQEREITDLKTKIMLSQIKPHFVFNALTAIAALCTRNPTQAKELTLDFSYYLRDNWEILEPDAAALCPFEKELEHIKTYLAIEEIRFGSRVRAEYDIQVSDFSVPPISIQPIVENAVKRGLCMKTGGGTVKIATARTDGGYRITITDDGIGFNPGEVPDDGKTHTGIENVKKRLALFGGSMTIESTPGAGTKATILIRKTEEEA